MAYILPMRVRMGPNLSLARTIAASLVVASTIQIGHSQAPPAAPPLAAPNGPTVNVSTESQLQSALAALRSDTTILLAPGTYRLTRTLWLDGALRGVSIRGASGNADDVVLAGPGMARATVGDTPYGIVVASGAADVEIANLTIRDIYYGSIVLMPGTLRPHVYNVHFVDAGEQFIDGRSDDGGKAVSGATIEYSTFEYSTTARSASVPAVSVRGGVQWTFRHNLFRNIVGPSWQLAGPAILAWGGSNGTVVDSNSFVNTSIGIAFGSADSQAVDHVGGVIRNNMIYRATGQSGDAAIRLVNAPSARVLNNTAFLSGTYGTPIEYQFQATRDVVIANNLTDGGVWARDGASGTEAGNYPSASADMFVDAAHGDLHLSSRAVSAIDRGVDVDVASDWDGRARPAGRAYDIGAHEFGSTVKLQAAQNVSISGRIVDATGGALANVRVSVTGSETHANTTDSSGNYVFYSLASGGSYQVTASLTGYIFAPESAAFPAATSHQNIANFVGMAVSSTPTPTPTGVATLTANPTAVSVGASSTLTLTTPSNNYHVVTLNGIAMAFGGCAPSTGSCTFTQLVTPAATTTYQSAAMDANLVPYPNMPSVTVTVTATTGPAPTTSGSATLTATPAILTAGQSSTLRLTMPNLNYHNVKINGMRPSITTVGSGLVGTLSVSPTATTTYQSTATDSTGAPYVMPSVAVTVSGTATATPAPTGPLPTGGLVQEGNLVQQGSFVLPQNISGVCCGGQSFDETAYMNGAIAFNAANQSLFIVGHDWGQHTAEISIPAFGGTATILQSFVDALYGQLARIDPDQETKKIGGLFVDGSNLLVSGYTYYDGLGNATASHFSRSTNLSNSAVIGPLTVGTLNPGFIGGYFAAIPTEWQAALGGDLLVGQCCLAVVGRTSFGPAAFAVNKVDIERGTNPVAAQPLAYYDENHQNLGLWSNVTTPNPVYNMTTSVKGAVIPPGSSTALFFGNTGLGVPCYGAGTSDPSLAGASYDGNPADVYCYDPANSAKGTHAYPYSGYVWAYNLSDFAAVRSGTKAPWDVAPYATWQLGVFATGAAYDPGTGRIFLSAAGSPESVLVFKIQ